MKTCITLAAACAALPLFAQHPLFDRDIAVGDAVGGSGYVYIGQTARTKAHVAPVRILDGKPRAPAGEDIQTSLPAGEEVQVILATADKKHYLIKSKDGNVGWLSADAKPVTNGKAKRDFSRLQRLETLPEALRNAETDTATTGRFGTGNPGLDIRYNPARIRAVEPVQNPGGVWILLKGKFGSDETEYTFACQGGWHCGLISDAELKAHAADNNPDANAFQAKGRIDGSRFYFPGDGSIYTTNGVTDPDKTPCADDLMTYRLNTFTTHGTDGTTHRWPEAEAIPPACKPAYRHVGHEGVMEGDYPLYRTENRADREGGIIADVKSGETVTVVLAQTDAMNMLTTNYVLTDVTGHYLLIKKQDGTMGWLHYQQPGWSNAPFAPPVRGYEPVRD